MNLPVSKYEALFHYKWGEDCDGWNLADEEGLSVKQERMPAGACEKLHYHKKANQFFYILEGAAQFEIDEEKIELKTGEGLMIAAGKKHRIINASNDSLEFLLCSQPSTQEDRINCE